MYESRKLPGENSVHRVEEKSMGNGKGSGLDERASSRAKRRC